MAKCRKTYSISSWIITCISNENITSKNPDPQELYKSQVIFVVQVGLWVSMPIETAKWCKESGMWGINKGPRTTFCPRSPKQVNLPMLITYSKKVIISVYSSREGQAIHNKPVTVTEVYEVKCLHIWSRLLCSFSAKPYLSSICFLLCQPLPCEVWDCTSLTDLWALWKSDFIKSLIPLVIYTVFDECHRSRCVDLIAALICLFNGVVEWKVVTTRCSTKRWVMGPAGKRWKGKMQNSRDVEESGGIKQGLPIHCAWERTDRGESWLLNVVSDSAVKVCSRLSSVARCG